MVSPLRSLLRGVALLACALPFTAQAAKLVDVRPVDEQVLMLYFKDGDVLFRDNGEGPSARTGHDYAPGDDQIVSFGEPLDTTEIHLPHGWKVTSADDARFGEKGLAPTAVHRKSKVNATNEAFQHRLDHWLFLRLPQPMKPGASYVVHVPAKAKSDQPSGKMTYAVDQVQSEAIHVNLIGYRPNSPVKAADLYLWLGDGGQRDYSSFIGRPVWLVDTKTGERHRGGEVRFWKKNVTRDTYRDEAFARNLTGSDVWSADFSAFNRPGTYRLVIDGVGASAEFRISDDVWFEPYKTSLRGYYYMRIGEPATANNPPPRQPRFVPGEDPAGFTVYLTDLDPFDEQWKKRRGDTWDEPHFIPAKDSIFWARRLPGNPTNPNAKGGHSDALDWDRHLAHVSDAYDLLLPYILTGGKLADDNLGIAESGNGIPDLIDEAQNEIDMFLSLRVGEGYAQGLTNPTRERTIMFQAGATTMAAWANAANAAMLSEAFRVAQKPELMAKYRDEAITAYRFASKQEPSQLDDLQEVGDAWMRGRDFRHMAAAYLYNVTGDKQWEDAMEADSVNRTAVTVLEQDERDVRWVQTWAAVAYLTTPHERHYPALAANLRAAIRQQAIERNVRHMHLRPSRRTSTNKHWQTPHNLQLVAVAHAFAEEPADRTQYERAMILEADWGLGRNPSNTVEMTGLGSRCYVNIYTSGRNDGVPGLHPGHTPYNNTEHWGVFPHGSNPRWFTSRGYPEWEAGGWPHQEAYFNSRYTWANGEFTPRQTMRGKMVLYAYLESLRR